MSLQFTGWCWNGEAWVALFASADEQVWYIGEEPLLTRVANGDGNLAAGLFGTANGIPPWGMRPDAHQITRGKRMLRDARPLGSAA